MNINIFSKFKYASLEGKILSIISLIIFATILIIWLPMSISSIKLFFSVLLIGIMIIIWCIYYEVKKEKDK